jgi:geranylgeranyl diphosphate synthase type I
MTIAPSPALDQVHELVQPALWAAVARLDPSSARIAAYHFGWAEADGSPGSGSGGKAIRPTLALLSARAAGAAAEVGVPGAVAVELVHNFSLLHDDLMDRDVQRRHRPTVWTVFGPAAAILTGDALLALAHEVLSEVGGEAGAAAGALLARATQQLVAGQVDDLGFETRSEVSVPECIAMAAGKTGALLAASSAIGAVLTGAAPQVVAALTEYGEQIGLAFQLVDDLLGIWGDPAVTGKPVGSDLRSRKKTLPVCYALSSDTDAAKELAALFDGEWEGTPRQTMLAAALVEVAGGREWARREASHCLDRAVAALRSADIPETVVDELDTLGRFVVGRES